MAYNPQGRMQTPEERLQLLLAIFNSGQDLTPAQKSEYESLSVARRNRRSHGQ